ncbi:MAG: glycosyltransferase family 9 protein [Candidatus Omnitrophota bacterium]
MKLRKLLDYWVGVPLLFLICSVLRFMPPRKIHSRRVLFIKLYGMGDVVLIMSGVKLFKEKFPDYQIDFLTTGEGYEIAASASWVDNVILFKESEIWRFCSLVAMLWRSRYEMCVDFEQFARISALCARATNAPHRVAFHSDRQCKHIGSTTSVLFNSSIHAALNFVQLLKPCGIEQDLDGLVSLPCDAENVEWARSLNVQVVLHPGSGNTGLGRRWPVSCFAKLAKWIIDEQGLNVSITGSKAEVKLCDDLVNSVEPRYRLKVNNLAGKTNIRQLISLFSVVKLVVANDTGPMHLAAAQGAGVIGLFGPNSPNRYRPFSKSAVVLYKGASCSPCIDIERAIVPDCPYLSPLGNEFVSLCMMAIEVSSVISAAKSLLQQRVSHE